VNIPAREPKFNAAAWLRRPGLRFRLRILRTRATNRANGQQQYGDSSNHIDLLNGSRQVAAITLHHSYRNEITGSTLGARRAGIYVANPDTAVSNTATEMKTAGSHVFTP
jgi:hypothetical protein